ncbi:DUF1415 domain-containing protein [Alteromonas aestuariivivens]|uniref:DUF1415 domain-containing protein n=1 Tax=Alteromonas aestuariivivens TaxID=1938339 RepID=A0A3D8MF92_9ALTE|nr:DUF1415 domain-containing protein [Alteromonas aestuariivivens]RDV29296.1 DUF1415 domain-containing protein [Alteromonas aestuariivivens]
MNTNRVIEATRKWLDDVVIEHNFCPFARFVRHPERIHYAVCQEASDEAILTQLLQECQRLDEQPGIATTLLMVPAGYDDFEGYLDLLTIAEQFLHSWGYEGIYQLASFHPRYVFEGEPEDSPGHFTNRAPYPTFHLIREADIERALQDYGDPDQIYQQNIALAEEKGCPYFQALLNGCLNPSGKK